MMDLETALNTARTAYDANPGDEQTTALVEAVIAIAKENPASDALQFLYMREYKPIKLRFHQWLRGESALILLNNEMKTPPSIITTDEVQNTQPFVEAPQILVVKR